MARNIAADQKPDNTIMRMVNGVNNEIMNIEQKILAQQASPSPRRKVQQDVRPEPVYDERKA